MTQFNEEIIVTTIKCSTCKHYIKGFKCKAYALIPEDIFNETVEHDKVRSDQEGNFIFTLDKSR